MHCDIDDLRHDDELGFLDSDDETDDALADAVRRESDAESLRLIMGDATARRELLWLRAMEKCDMEDARDLESVDPSVTLRLADAGVLPRPLPGEHWRDRADRWGRAWDVTYVRHARRLRRR